MPRGTQLVFCGAPTDKGLSCVRGPLYTRVTCADDQHGNRGGAGGCISCLRDPFHSATCSPMVIFACILLKEFQCHHLGPG